MLNSFLVPFLVFFFKWWFLYSFNWLWANLGLLWGKGSKQTSIQTRSVLILRLAYRCQFGSWILSQHWLRAVSSTAPGSGRVMQEMQGRLPMYTGPPSCCSLLKYQRLEVAAPFCLTIGPSQHAMTTWAALSSLLCPYSKLSSQCPESIWLRD